MFSLPGNPVSTLLTFEQFVRPALLKMMGHRTLLRPVVRAVFQEHVARKPGRVSFLRVRLERRDSGLLAWTSGNQETGILKTIAAGGRDRGHPGRLGVRPDGRPRRGPDAPRRPRDRGLGARRQRVLPVRAGRAIGISSAPPTSARWRCSSAASTSPLRIRRSTHGERSPRRPGSRCCCRGEPQPPLGVPGPRRRSRSCTWRRSRSSSSPP